VNRRATIILTIFLVVTGLTLLRRCGCGTKAAAISGSPTIPVTIPAGIPDPVYLFTRNTFTEEKATLGRYLFYDRRLSANNTKACASCHAQEFSFTDGYRRSTGIQGDLLQRNSKPLVNLIFNYYLTAGDSSIHFPEQQISSPMFNVHPVEMGIAGNEQQVLQRLMQDKEYNKRFSKAFPDEENPVSIKNIQFAISSFIKTITGFDSPYDKYLLKKDMAALNESQKKGMQLFFSDSLQCGSCHGGINFATPSLKDANGQTIHYFNTGLYNIGDSNAYPSTDHGLASVTKKLIDNGKFLVPTLRNLAFTAPYYHDGTAATLEEVIIGYEEGGRNIRSGAHKGDGRKNINKHPLIKGFRLNSQERKALVAFLLSLSDSAICNNPAYANPFTIDETQK
jgi:cytochrome c peroxidase